MKVLVLGSGQLAQMMFLAAAPLGVEVMAFDVNARELVHPVSKQSLDISLATAIDDAKAITVEFEHIPEDLLETSSESGKLYPNIQSILAGADRVREKALLSAGKVANSDHVIIDALEQLDDIEQNLGEKVIFKASRDGYDGYGQWRMSAISELPTLRDIFAKLQLSKVPLVAERMVAFDREISVIGARNIEGDICCYDIAENLHYQGQLHVSVAPATNISKELQARSEEIFAAIAQALNYVGVLAVELFQLGDTLLVNEIAPRVHNSGHWTQKGSDTSQFEQHIRAVLGFPLGSTKASKVTAMVNIIGCTAFSRDLIGIPGCHLHWYGKTLREKRKMGHINVVADSYRELGEKLECLLDYLPEEYFPLLRAESERLKALNSH